MSSRTERTDVGEVDELLASASKMTALNDYGDDDLTEPLAVLLESYQRDAELTPLGSTMNRWFVKSALAARLIAQAGFAANPSLADVPIERPIFVTGLPRSGTTALHRLLTADGRHQGLQMWLTEVPQTRPPRETWPQNPVFAEIDKRFAQHHVDDPELMGLHYMSASEVEECWQLLRQSLRTQSYESLAYLPTYSRWLAAQDLTPAYRRHRQNLQLIGAADADKRWVLKNPSHLFGLDALLATYPDAIIVQTHRRPSTIIASMCSLAEHSTRGWSTGFTPERIGQVQVELWSRGLDLFTQARSRHPETTFIDVDFADLRADPLGTVRSIYREIGSDLSDDAVAAMVALDEESRSGDRRPVHNYALEDYGLTERDVDAAFG